MKKISLLFLLIFTISFFTISAQSTNSLYKKNPSLSVNFMLNDYRSATAINNSSLSEALRTDKLSSFTDMSPGVSISYYKGLSDHFDFMSTIGGSSPRYDFKNGKANRSAKILLEADAAVNMKLLSDNYKVTPYLTLGVGASLYGVHYGAYIPMGLGIQFKLGEDAFLFTNLQYRNGITEFANNHLNYSLGFGAPLILSKKNN
jgi:hypothetical protein